jgi:hypothetical protein
MYFQDKDFNFSVVVLYEQKLLSGVKQYVRAYKLEDYELTVKVVDRVDCNITHTYLSSVIFYGWHVNNIDFYYRNNYNNYNNFKALESLICLYYRLVKDNIYVNVKIIQCEYFKRSQILFDANIFDALASVLVNLNAKLDKFVC